jgi:hypothetical protein
MNSDSFFESEFFIEYKGLITVFCTITISFFTILYLFTKLKTNNNALTTNSNINNRSQNEPTINKTLKYKLTINAVDTLFSDINNCDIGEIYTYLSKLSKRYDIFLLIIINENEDQEKIIERFKPLIEDNIILKHRILFSSKQEGLCAMVRSINPFAHVESIYLLFINKVRSLSFRI